VLLAGAFAIGIGVYALHSASTPPAAPERPRPPPPAATLANSDLRFSPVFYRTQLEQDAKSYGIPAPSWDEITQPNPYFDELKGSSACASKRPSKPATCACHWRSARLCPSSKARPSPRTIWFCASRIGRPLYLAYRIQTSVPDKHRCSNKGEIPHNAMAIAPNQTILRTECLYRREETVDVSRIEVMEMPALSAYYVSRLRPMRLSTTHALFPDMWDFAVATPASRRFRGTRSRMESTRSSSTGETSSTTTPATTATSTPFSRPIATAPDSNAPLPARPLD